jgi:hypothetical protein
LVAGGGVFEFKTAEAISPRHRGQLYNYLLLLDLAHGKLVNMRPEIVCHEFVNATVRTADRHRFKVDATLWNGSLDGGDPVLEMIVSLLHDWGTGLELRLYEAALTHFLGGEEYVVRKVDVRGQRELVGQQWMRFAADGVAFKITAFNSDNNQFEEHTRRLLNHTDLKAMLWINIDLQRVSFTTIEQGGL